MKPRAVIFDIDGTVAIRDNGPDGRDPYDMTRVGEDRPNRNVLALARALCDTTPGNDVTIIYVSGRDETASFQTGMWLQEHYGPEFFLFMRREHDNRPDTEVKGEILDRILEHFTVIGVFDDRNCVVDMWRERGLTCYQVCSREEGDF